MLCYIKTYGLIFHFKQIFYPRIICNNMSWSFGKYQFIQFGSVQLLSRVWLCDPVNPACKASLFIIIYRSSLKLMSIESVMPSSHLILCHPLLLLPQSLPASESFPMSQLFAWGGQSTGVSALASFLQRTPRADLLQNGLVGSPCSPRDSQESSPTPQFKSINSSVLSLLNTQKSYTKMILLTQTNMMVWSLS